MDALGRVFNVLYTADDVYVSMIDCSAITFVSFLAAGDTYTLTEATAQAGTGNQVLTTIDHFWVQATPGAAWVAVSQAAASTMVTTSAQDVCVLTVHESELSAGYKWIKLTSTSTGLVVAIQHDLKVQRKPSNLPNLV